MSASADILELKNGSILNGKYVDGTVGTVRFETSAGMQVVETAKIIALTFTTPAAAPAAAPVAAPTSVTLPYGTMLLVKRMDSVSSKSRPGASWLRKNLRG